MTHFLIGLAQAAPAGGGGGGLLQTPLVPMVIIVGIFYFLLIRPNAKKQKELQKMLSELKKGDDVSTQGGIIGKITGLKDNEVTLQVQEGFASGSCAAPSPASTRVTRPRRRPRRTKPKRRNWRARNTDENDSWNVPGGGRRPSTVSSPYWLSSI